MSSKVKSEDRKYSVILAAKLTGLENLLHL